ncbi:MAG: beta-N-acetylhexosaminidase [Planktomarina sp.]
MSVVDRQLSPIIYGCQGTVLTKEEAVFFGQTQPFGFILFSRNLEKPVQIQRLCDDLRNAVGWHAPILIDQEGGRVSRLGAPHWFEVCAALDMADHPKSERVFWLRGRIIAHDLLSCGIDVNCAPVADIARDHTHAVLQNRCYGRTADQVVTHAQALVDGQSHGGVAAVVKHIPGHGLATLDSHLALPHVSAGRGALENHDFKVFRALNAIDMGMTAHLVYDDIDPDHPATQSATMIDLIRTEIGFSGFLMSDDISMNALAGDVVTRACAAWAAGCDAVLHCNGDLTEMRNLAENLPKPSKAVATRMVDALKNRPTAIPVDIEALKAEFTSLINRVY